MEVVPEQSKMYVKCLRSDGIRGFVYFVKSEIRMLSNPTEQAVQVLRAFRATRTRLHGIKQQTSSNDPPFATTRFGYNYNFGSFHDTESYTYTCDSALNAQSWDKM